LVPITVKKGLPRVVVDGIDVVPRFEYVTGGSMDEVSHFEHVIAGSEDEVSLFDNDGQ
jgi:hypothetical protein